MQSYWLFVGFSVVAIATPGPGVLLTVSNALRYGFSRSLPGILGLAIGMLGVGLVSGAGRAQCCCHRPLLSASLSTLAPRISSIWAQRAFSPNVRQRRRQLMQLTSPVRASSPRVPL